MLIIDLHGLDIEEATGAIQSALINLDMEIDESIEFITGKGETLSYVLEDILDSEGYSWFHENNNYGSYIVKR